MLTELELKYKHEFKINADDIDSAVQSANTYGQTLIDFRFVCRYFLLIINDVVLCFPTDDSRANMSKFIEYYNLRKI
jgi:hypothetical protein